MEELAASAAAIVDVEEGKSPDPKLAPKEINFSGRAMISKEIQVFMDSCLEKYNDLMCFHRTVKADDWLLFAIESPTASGGRGFVSGQMFNKKGELIVSVTQEALIRKAKAHNQIPQSKL